MNGGSRSRQRISLNALPCWRLIHPLFQPQRCRQPSALHSQPFPYQWVVPVSSFFIPLPPPWPSPLVWFIVSIRPPYERESRNKIPESCGRKMEPTKLKVEPEVWEGDRETIGTKGRSLGPMGRKR